MKRLKFMLAALCLSSIGASAQDWNGIPIPANAPSGMVWELNPVSDSFNYESNTRSIHPEFEKRWNELYINGFSGPSATSYHKDHTWITNGMLNIHAAWDATLPIVYTGCISSKSTLSYPMYMESRVKQAGCMLANNIWMISDDETEELDMLESYPNTQPGREFLDERIHLSHHTFIREPFTDYQPRDEEGVFGTWYFEEDRKTWRKDFFTIGVYWKNPHHAEYYINGKLVRTIKKNEHSFVDPQGNLSEHTTSFDAIDKYGYTGGTGLSKPQHIIINMEQQSWLAALNIFPTREDLDDKNQRNLFLVDWIRVYDAVPTGGRVPVTDIQVTPVDVNIRPGETFNLNASIIPSNATTQAITWTTSNSTIAIVNGAGVVTGISEGTVTAEVTTQDGGLVGISTVRVSGTPVAPTDTSIDVEAVSISPREATVGVGETVELNGAIIPFNATVQSIGWATSNSSVAQVDNLGVVTAVSTGTTTITATTLEGEKTDAVVITVTDNSGGSADPAVSVTGLNVSPATITIGIGEVECLKGTVAPANASNGAVNWSSNNTDVVLVNNSGVITGVANGTATITATSRDGSFTDTSVVTVGEGGGSGPIDPVDPVVNGGTLTGGPFTFTVGDGIADNVSGVSLSGNVGANSQYVVTDDQGVILGLPGVPTAVNFDTAGTGTCFIYHLSYEGTIGGLTAGANISGFTGNFDLSNSIRVNRNPVVVVVDPAGDKIVIEAETFISTNGTFDDASAGGPGLGVNQTAVGINYVNRGDYAEYTINVGSAGEYAIEYLISTPSDNAQIQLAINGTALVTDNVPNNGDWDAYTTLTSGTVINLSTGVQTLRVTGSGTNDWQWNLDKITLTKQGGTTAPVVNGGTLTGGPFTFVVDGIADNVSGVSVSGNQGANSGWVVTDESLNILGLPPTPQAVNFDDAGTGVCLIWHISYESGLTGLSVGENVSGLQGTYDLSSNSVRVERNAAPTTGQNATLVIEAEDFDTTGGTFDDAFAGGPGSGVNNAGANINYVNSGDYVEYTVDVAVAGTYTIDYSISSPSDNAQIEFDVVGSSASTTTNVPNNGQWDSFGSLDGGTVALAAGSNTIRITASGSNVWQWNLDKITLSTGGSGAKNIEGSTSLGLSVYPNPATDAVFVEGLDLTQVNTIHMYDITGAEYPININADASINVEGLASGVYFITVMSLEKGKQTARLLKN
ncbi:Ig-like domain-containing protein [Aquimarina agarilytica]|uniref:Ig-like domain-containing protein n=1 Tax=Aquimarina agarilytica TaxID=1087449 RepID=UPI00028A33BC|nr:Ig-like domain-containing protein [Aquimarina agarilytica]